MDENLGELFGALAAARLEFADIVKSKTVQVKGDKANYSYNYADIASIIEATAPALAKHGLIFIQTPEVATEGGRTVVIVHGVLAHKSGATYTVMPLLMPVGASTPQSIGSAITFARRYQLSAALNLAAADDDGNEAGIDANTPRSAQNTPKTAQKAQRPTHSPKRTVDTSTGEILEPVNGNGKHVNNPFEDADQPYYVAAWQKLTGKHYDLVNWVRQLHRKGEQCSKAQYGLVTGIVDALTNEEHNYALSVLCQAEISKANMPSKDAASALLKFLQKEINAIDENGKEIKGDNGKPVKVPNPQYRQDMADMITEIGAQMEKLENVELALEPEVAF